MTDEYELNIPNLSNVLEAKRTISRYLPRTPLYTYPTVNQLIGTEVYIKHENYMPTGAFKIRGGINLMAHFTEEEKKIGIIGSSTGNFGQSLAYASRLFGVKARIVVPEGANPGKVAAMEGYGTEVIFHGRVYDEARRHAEYLAETKGYRYISSGNQPRIIAGVATCALEMLEDQPGLDYIIVPVGAGSGAAGACISAKAVKPDVKVIACQAEQAPASYLSWKTGEMTAADSTTFAEGLATGFGSRFQIHVMRRWLDDFILLTEDELKQAMVWMIERAHSLAESAGAASLAAAYRLRKELAGARVGLVLSGGNTSLEHLKLALNSNAAI